jgi:ketosteroid isomerase-like protein
LIKLRVSAVIDTPGAIQRLFTFEQKGRRRMKTILSTGILLLALALSATRVLAQANDPAAVIEQYTAAVNAFNVNAAVDLLAEDAVLKLGPDAPPTGVYTGKTAIRDYLESRFGDTVVEITEAPKVEGDKVTWTEKESYLATTTNQKMEAIVRDGKINSITVSEVLSTDPRSAPAGPVGRIFALVDVLNDHQLDSAVSLFSGDAVIKLSPDSPPPNIFTGKDEIRSHFQNFIDEDVKFEFVVPPQLIGDKVVWTDKLSSGLLTTTQSLEAVVQGGEIKSMVVTKLLSSEPRVVPTTGATGSFGLTGYLLLAGFALVALGGFFWQRGKRSHSTS